MLVASGVEFGDDIKAAVALFKQVIGNIQAAVGCGTLTRADGIPDQVVVGDPVRQGDVIETGPDGRIEIRFNDGTVFKLCGDSRVVLREFVCDSDCVGSALFAVTKGTFAFVGGRLARTGSLWVDTPVGSIRGQPRASGFGLLSLAALVFSIGKEAHAGDPDVTIPDDDRITYKDFEHGAFELVTKEAIPRHIIVEDPGETIVLTKRGSSVGVNQVANSPARMEELRAAQQDALANFAKAWGPSGSSTPDFLNPQHLLQPINFIQTDPVHQQNSLPPLEIAVFRFQEIIVGHLPPPPLVLPTLNLGTGPIEIDTVNFDTFASSPGTFSASKGSTSGSILTFGISGGSALVGDATYDVSKTGQFGTLYLNSKTGAYNFIPNNDAINALKASTTQSFTITGSDGSLSVDQTFSISIFGADDAAKISGTITGSVVGPGAVADASPALLIASGRLTDTDVDDPNDTFTAVGSPTKSAGGYGSFTLTASGVWTYILDNANSAVRALKVGDTVTDTFTVTTIGGTPQVVTITVHGPLIATTGTTPSLTLSETHLTATATDDNIAGSVPNAALTTTMGHFSTAFASVQGTDGVTLSYALSIIGGNGSASGLTDSHTGQPDVLVLNGNTIEGHVGTTGGTLAFTITLDPTTGSVTFTEYRAVTQPFGTSPDGGEGASLTAGIVNLVATITNKDGNFQTVSIDLGKQLTITDDGPSIMTTGTAPSLTLSETHLTAAALDDNIAGSAPNATLTTATGDFSTAFTSVQGADGATIKYALSIVGGNGTASGLIDSHTGLTDVLVLDGNTIECRVGSAGGALAFTITLDPTTGSVTFTEYRAVTQPSGTNPDGGEGVSLTSGIVKLVATIADKDGDLQTASIDLGKQLTIKDDGPSITVTGTAPSLTLSETHLTATALDGNIAGSAPNAALTTTTGEFSTAFTSVQGADGATLSYALSIVGGDGTASGLIDSRTGLADVLVLEGNTIEGRVGTTGGMLAFTIKLDPTTGSVTFTEYRAVTQPSGTNPDGGEGVSLTAGIVNLVATISDKDGDFRTASIDLGKQLTITDDGPTIGGFGQVFLAAQDDQIANGSYNINFGADGDAAMLVAVRNGPVGSTGFNLATSSLGGGITSVHVTGNGDDYTFYYSTHAVSGGVELDAYFTGTNGTLTDPYFTLLIKPDGTYSLDLHSVELLKQVTVTGSIFGASSGGTPSLAAPDGQLVITGSDNGGHSLDVKASNNGIAVGDTGLQMDPNEDLHLTFSQEQSKVSFNLTQWQGNGTANVIFKVFDGTTDIHDFSINIQKPSGGITNIVLQETSNAALIDTYTFDSATSTYTLYVEQTFNQVQVDYNQAVAGNATFTVNNITYDETSTIPSTDLLFDVSAVDGDGDSAATTLQVNLQGGTTVATALPLTGISGSAMPAPGGGNDATATISSTTTTTTTGSVLEATGTTSATPVADGTLANINVDSAPDTFTTVRSSTKSDRSHGTLPKMAAGVWANTPDNNSAMNALNIGDALNNTILNGFGAVLLTGGNGIGSFGNSFGAFTSGSGKIDLTSFGTLAFVALAPTSTSVPAHTIAWLFHAATYETIVYVNPTDQTLSIGDTGLVEMHLAGVTSIEPSDFVFASTVALTDSAPIDPAAMMACDGAIIPTSISDASSGTIARDAAAMSTTHKTDIGDGIDVTPDKLVWIDDPGYAGFRETRTESSEHTVEETVITLPSGRSVDLPHVSFMAQIETGFVFDRVLGFGRADETAIGHDPMMHGLALVSRDWTLPFESHWKIASATGSVGDESHGASSQKNPSLTDKADANDYSNLFDSTPAGVKVSEGSGSNHSNSSEHGASPVHGVGAHDGGPPLIGLDSYAMPQPGGLKASENGGGNHSLSSEAGEHGLPPVHAASVHDVESPTVAHGVFGSGTVDKLGIGDSFHFNDKTSGSGVASVIDHSAPSGIAAIGHHDDAALAHGPLAVGPHPPDVPLPGAADDISIAADHGNNHLVANAHHDLIV